MSQPHESQTNPLRANPDPLLTLAQVGDYCGTSLRWAQRQVGTGTLPYVKVGRLVRVRTSDLDQYLAVRRVPAREGGTR